MTSGRRWCETRKAEATLDAYQKYARQDEGLRDEAIGGKSGLYHQDRRYDCFDASILP